MKRHKAILLFIILSLTLFFNLWSFVAAEEIITMTGEITEYKSNALIMDGTDFYAYYDASTLKISKPIEYKGKEIRIMHRVKPHPDGRKVVDSKWKENGKFITFSILRSKLEHSFKNGSHKRPPWVYVTSISIEN